MLNSELIYQSENYKGYTINWVYDQCSESPREWSNVTEIDSWNRNNSYADYNFSDRESAIVDFLDRYSSEEEIGKYLIKGEGDAKLVITTENDYCEVAIYNGTEKESCCVDIIPSGTETDYWNAFCEEMENEVMETVASMISLYDLREMLKDSVNLYGLSVNNYGAKIELNDTPMFYCGIEAIVSVTKDKALKDLGNVNDQNWYERAEKVIEGEMNEFSSYITGEVFGFVVEDQSGNEIDSCYGFIGQDSIDENTKDIQAFIDSEIEKENEFRKRNSKVLNLVDKIKEVLQPEGYSLELVKLA